jgi:hypothetical protein
MRLVKSKMIYYINNELLDPEGSLNTFVRNIQFSHVRKKAKRLVGYRLFQSTRMTSLTLTGTASRINSRALTEERRK